MSLWKNVDSANSVIPLYKSEYISASNVANTSANSFVYGINTRPSGAASSGWIREVKGTGGRLNRKQVETLVATKIV